MEWLKKLLGDELFAKLEASGELFTQLKPKLEGAKVVVDDGTLIPKYRLDQSSEKIKALNEQIAASDKQLKELKTAADGNKDLVAKIETLEKASVEASKKATSKEKALAIKEALLNKGVTDPNHRNLLAKEFDLETVELDDKGEVKNFDKLVEPVQTNYKVLFGTVEKKGFGVDKGDGAKKPEPKFTRDQVNAMSQAEVNTNYDEIQKSMENW